MLKLSLRVGHLEEVLRIKYYCRKNLLRNITIKGNYIISSDNTLKFAIGFFSRGYRQSKCILPFGRKGRRDICDTEWMRKGDGSEALHM